MILLFFSSSFSFFFGSFSRVLFWSAPDLGLSPRLQRQIFAAPATNNHGSTVATPPVATATAETPTSKNRKDQHPPIKSNEKARRLPPQPIATRGRLLQPIKPAEGVKTRKRPRRAARWKPTTEASRGLPVPLRKQWLNLCYLGA